MTRADARCPASEQITKAAATARTGYMGHRLVAVVLHHPQQSGKRYRLATVEDERCFATATAYLAEKLAP